MSVATDLTARVNHFEWLVRQHLRPGSKPGKVIRRVLEQGQYCPFGVPYFLVQDLTGCWKRFDGLGVVFSQDRFVWETAYDTCRSCMRGKGDLIHAAYVPSGFLLACLWDDVTNECLARTLISPRAEKFGGPAFNKIYGSKHYWLGVILDYICRIDSTCDWLDGLDTRNIAAYKKPPNLLNGYDSYRVEVVDWQPIRYGSYKATQQRGWVVREFHKWNWDNVRFVPWVDGLEETPEPSFFGRRTYWDDNWEQHVPRNILKKWEFSL